MSGQLVLRRVPYDHPDATALIFEAQQFYTELYGSPDATPFTVAEFAPPDGGFFVGYIEDAPVAVGGWRLSDAGVPAQARRVAELKRMFTTASARRGGYARQLLGALEEDARSAGADWMILQTGAPQVAAVAFYTARGYRPVPTYGYYANAPEVVNLGRPLAART